MTGRLFSFLIFIALGSGVLDATPLKSGGKECLMSRQIKCCERNALGRMNDEEKSRAKTCGTVFCEQSGVGAPTVRIPQFSTLIVAAAYFQTLRLIPASPPQVSKAEFSEISSSHRVISSFLQNSAFIR